MSSTLIVLVGFVYLYISGESFFKNDIPVSIMFAGYAVANIGAYLQVAK